MKSDLRGSDNDDVVTAGALRFGLALDMATLAIELRKFR
jgi:hypothetical protein